MAAQRSRGKTIRNVTGLVLYLAGGWRSYLDIAEEFGWAVRKCGSSDAHTCKTAYRNVRALEEAGLPVEWSIPPDRYGGSGGELQKARLPADWVTRCPWLRRYITPPQPVKLERISHK